MIRLTTFFFIFFFKAYAISVSYPELYFNLGTSYQSLQGERPMYTSDFLNVNIGATLEYHIDEKSLVNLVIDSSYTPNRRKIKLYKNQDKIQGDSDLLTSFYSLNYGALLNKKNKKEWWFGIGPAMGLYTLQFHRFQANESDVDEINRIRIRNFGLRSSIKSMDEKAGFYYELAHYYLIQDKLTVIDDASLDAEAVSIERSIERTVNWSLFFNIGWKLY